MGVRTKSRITPPRTIVQPKPIEPINDAGYAGKHPDLLPYTHIENFHDPRISPRSIELRAFSKNALEQLRALAQDHLLPLLDHYGYNLSVLCEKPRDGGGNRKLTLGVLFNAGQAAQDNGERQLMMIRKPDASDSRVLYTLLHESVHISQPDHAEGFRRVFGEMIDWAIGSGTDFAAHRDALLGHAVADTYAPPTAPAAGGWDSYAAPRTTASPSVAA